MLPGYNDNSQTAYQSIMDLYQRCRRNGDWAKVYLETRDGQDFCTISLHSSAGGSAAGVAREEKAKNVRTKKPSQVRRDRLRRAAFLERRNQAAAAALATPTPRVDNSNAGTDNVEEDEKIANKSVAGTTSFSEDIAGEISKPAKNETTVEEKEEGLTEENIEQLREIIQNATSDLMKKIDVRVWDFEAPNNETLEGDTMDQNDNFEDAKLWVLRQKQSPTKNHCTRN